MLGRHIDRILELAQENQELARIERALLVRMIHIYQGHYKENKIATLVPKEDRKSFLIGIAPAFNHKSPRYRRRALILTFSLIGISETHIAEFFAMSRHADTGLSADIE